MPAKPANFAATAGNAQVVLAGFHACGTDDLACHRYEVQRKEGPGGSYGGWTPADYKAVQTGTYNGVAQYEARHMVMGLRNGETYSFRVRHVNLAGPGPASDEKTVTLPAVVPAAPTGVVAIASDGQVLPHWDDPKNPGITGYQFQQKEGAAGSYGP